MTPLSKRVYSESNDQEMDIWLQVTDLDVNRIKTSNVFMIFQLAVPPADWPGHKTLSLTVTPFMKSCRKEDRKLRFIYIIASMRSN